MGRWVGGGVEEINRWIGEREKEIGERYMIDIR